MKYLGIDYGSKRVGLSISDESESFAMPLCVISNTKELVEEISRICVEQSIGTIVVGESKDYAGRQNEIMREITPFVSSLVDKLDIPIHMHPEFLTSLEAKQLQGDNEMNDASAAALILKSYLDVKSSKL